MSLFDKIKNTLTEQSNSGSGKKVKFGSGAKGEFASGSASMGGEDKTYVKQGKKPLKGKNVKAGQTTGTQTPKRGATTIRQTGQTNLFTGKVEKPQEVKVKTTYQKKTTKPIRVNPNQGKLNFDSPRQIVKNLDKRDVQIKKLDQQIIKPKSGDAERTDKFIKRKQKSYDIQSKSALKKAKKYAAGGYPKIGGGGLKPDMKTPVKGTTPVKTNVSKLNVDKIFTDKTKTKSSSTVVPKNITPKSKGTTPVKVNITKPIKQSEVSKKAKEFTAKVNKANVKVQKNYSGRKAVRIKDASKYKATGSIARGVYKPQFFGDVVPRSTYKSSPVGQRAYDFEKMKIDARDQKRAADKLDRKLDKSLMKDGKYPKELQKAMKKDGITKPSQAVRRAAKETGDKLRAGDPKAKKQVFDAMDRQFKKMSPAQQSKELSRIIKTQTAKGRKFNPKTGNFEDPLGFEQQARKQRSKKVFPGDKSGAYQRVKTDIETKNLIKKAGGSGDIGFTAPNRKAKVAKRQMRADKLGLKDPFKVDTSKAAKEVAKTFGTKPVKGGLDIGKETTPSKSKGIKLTTPKDVKLPASFRDFDKKLKTYKADVEKISSKTPKKITKLYPAVKPPGVPQKGTIVKTPVKTPPTPSGTYSMVGTGKKEVVSRKKFVQSVLKSPEYVKAKESKPNPSKFIDQDTGKTFNMADPADKKKYLKQYGKDKFIKQTGGGAGGSGGGSGRRGGGFLPGGSGGSGGRNFKGMAKKFGGKLKNFAKANPLATALAVGAAGYYGYKGIKRAIDGPQLDPRKDFTKTGKIQYGSGSTRDDRDGKKVGDPVRFTYGRKETKNRAKPFLTPDTKKSDGSITKGSISKFRDKVYTVKDKSGKTIDVNKRIQNSAFTKQLRDASTSKKQSAKDFIKKYKKAAEYRGITT